MEGKAMYDVAIIGAGPAGASAALFTAKAGKRTLMFDNGKSITKRALVKNHYGVKEVTGPDLISLGKEQAQQFGAEIVEQTVIDVKPIDGGFLLKTEEAEYQAKHLLLATGMQVDLAEKIGLEILPGKEPRMKARVAVDEEGRTKIPGIWAAGTIAGVSVHTIVTAGHGAQVAINIISELNGERYVDHDVL